MSQYTWSLSKEQKDQRSAGAKEQIPNYYVVCTVLYRISYHELQRYKEIYMSEKNELSYTKTTYCMLIQYVVEDQFSLD